MYGAAAGAVAKNESGEEVDMTKLPSREETILQHRTAIEMALCQRDYELVAEHHPTLLDLIEAAVSDGVTPETLKRWAMATVQESGLVQRIYNASRWAVEVGA